MTENAWDRLRSRNLEFLTENNQNGGVWQEELNTVLTDLSAMGEQTDTGEMLDIVQRANRLTLLIKTEQQNNADLKEQIERFTPNTWAAIEGAPASRKQQQKVGDQLMSGISLQEGDRVAMEVTPEGKVIVEHIFNTCIEKGIPFDVTMPDHAFGRLLINACTPEQAYIYGREKWAVFDRDPEAKYLAVRREYASDVESVIDQDTIASKVDPVGRAKNEARKSHKETYCLTYIPTPEEAEVDGMPYDEYLELFFQLCTQPWEQIQEAQANLIPAFNRCKGFRVENEDGTDVSMSIDGFTFANSVVARNVPGSEIFSAPVRDSVNGKVVAKGKFRLTGIADVIEDMTFIFKDGKIIDYDAAVNKKGLGEYLDRHPENRYVGELGIGTNPWLKRHVANGLLVEKIGGSFHLALGHCYGNGYLGDDTVIMDNGNNESPDHQDLTTMLHGKQGKMYLVDENGVEHLVQENGEWLAVPELGFEQKHMDILNKGWEAVREQEGDARVPAEWRAILDQGKASTPGR